MRHRVPHQRACASEPHPEPRQFGRELAPADLLVPLHPADLEKFPQTVPHPCPAVPVANTTLQNTVKERPPLPFGPVAIVLHQLQHGILHEIQRLVLIPCGNLCHTECPPFDPCQEPIQCLGSIQRSHPLTQAKAAGLSIYGGIRMKVVHRRLPHQHSMEGQNGIPNVG